MDDAMTETGSEHTLPDDGRSGDHAASGESAARAEKLDLELVMDVPVTMQVVLGSTTLSVANILKLGRGAVVKLDTKVGDPVDVVVNGRVIARGEIVVLDSEDQRFGVTLTEVAKPGARLTTKTQRAA